MPNFKSGYAPCGQSGDGSYGASLAKQTSTVIDPVRDRILDLVKSIPFPDRNSAFNIGDYGTADGAASLNFIRDLITTVRKHHDPDVHVQVIYEDQPINDFNSLFKRLCGIIQDLPSYLLELENVYPLASGIDFRKACVPPDSMHFIMSMIAVHWLSRTPVLYQDSLYIYPDSTVEERDALRQQARADWETFLVMRSKELKHGGILLVACVGENGENGAAFTSKNMLYILTDVWKSFRDTGRITAQEFLNTNIGLCMYNINQLMEPFEDANSPVFQTGLRLLSAEVTVHKCVFYNTWKEKKDETGLDDREWFAKNYVTAHKNWSHNMFLNGLSENRTHEEKLEIIEDLYRRVETQIRERDPEELKNDNIYNYVIMRKE